MFITTAGGGIIAGGLLGGLLGGKGSSQSGTQTVTQKQELDPRIASILFGDGTKQLKEGVQPTYSSKYNFGTGQWDQVQSNPDSDFNPSGLLGQFQSLGNTPQAAGSKIYGQAGDNYVGKFGAYDMEQQRDAANKLMSGSLSAPTMQAAQVNAPSQNGMNLSSSYDSLINGAPGANPFLTGAIQKGINQSSNAFGNYLEDSKKATQDMLGGIRGNAVLAGQYGGSRQGVAEGKAIDSMNTQLGRAASQFGQNNTDAAVSAQSGQYSADRDRQLAATQGLSGQQYGLASQNASLQQQANQANLQSQLSTNGQNSANTIAGIGANSGVLSNAYGVAGAQDAYDLNKAGKMGGLLSPFIGTGASNTTSQPLYQNTAGNMLGGATAGLGLYNQLKGAFGNSGSNSGIGTGSYGGGPAGTYFDGYGWMPNTSALT